jgi:hypothetical protein
LQAAFIEREDVLKQIALALPEGTESAPLGEALKAVLADIDRHLRRIDANEIGHGADIAAALAEVGLPATKGVDQRTRARLAAVENDRVLLDAAFVRAFPPVADAAAMPLAGDDARIAEVLACLATIAEVVETFGAAPVERKADAIELLERLLAEAHVTPWDYAEVVRQPAPAVATALRAVHAAARFTKIA